ncbi:MAG: protein-tyrosine-phosphatase [Acetobacteraceae bacterium]|nr:protein-tyrosine-phosphatase [Acetobacteraceae bacterium]
MEPSTILAPFNATICGIEELGCHCASGVSHVLSILDPDWPVPEAFGAFGEHERLELRFHDVIEDAPGSVVPGPEHVQKLLSFGRSLVGPDAHMLVHCHAGVSRSSAAMALLLAQALPSIPADQIFREVLRIRSKAWPNLRIVEMGDAMLGRRDELIEAAYSLYRWHIERRPELADIMAQSGRGREVNAALVRAPLV